MRLAVYWSTRDPVKREEIRNRFNIPNCITINRETKVDISEEDLKSLREYEKEKLIQIRIKS